MAHSMRTPLLEPLDQYFSSLARMVANTSWLPHPDTVYALGRAAFPTARARRGHPRFTFICDNGKRVGMYDDNTTPRWAILGAHGIRNWRDRKGWAFAHVWRSRESDNINSYTQPCQPGDDSRMLCKPYRQELPADRLFTVARKDRLRVEARRRRTADAGGTRPFSFSNDAISSTSRPADTVPYTIR